MIHTEYAVLSNIGGRDVNEDSVAIQGTHAGLCAVVADGVGGQGSGDIASRTAVQQILRSFQAGGIASPDGIVAAIAGADAAVQKVQTEECIMMTTVATLCIEGEQAIWGHVGDSRLYYFRNGGLETVTLDHSVSQTAVVLGMITPDQIRLHPDRNKVLRALGSSHAEPTISEPLHLDEAFHAFLLCTDGFWEYVLEQDMLETLSNAVNPEQWLAEMEKRAARRAPDDRDNYTAAAVFLQSIRQF